MTLYNFSWYLKENAWIFDFILYKRTKLKMLIIIIIKFFHFPNKVNIEDKLDSTLLITSLLMLLKKSLLYKKKSIIIIKKLEIKIINSGI